MDLDTITVSNFKTQFYRDFPYLKIWDGSTTYNSDQEAYYSVNELFYKCLNDGVTSVPTTVADWEKITDSIYNYILDADITKAFSQAKVNFNQAIWGSDAEIQLAYLYLTAHYLVIDIRHSSSGINSTGDFNRSAQSVGNVSETLHIPDRIANNPIYHLYTTTGYGMKYLALALPRITGRVGVVQGGTVA